MRCRYFRYFKYFYLCVITALFQDIELLVSIFPFLVDACKDLLFCKYISQQCRAGGSRGQCCSSGCLEIAILCLGPAFGVGDVRKVDGSWKVSKAPEPSAVVCHWLCPQEPMWCHGHTQAVNAPATLNFEFFKE